MRFVWLGGGALIKLRVIEGVTRGRHELLDSRAVQTNCGEKVYGRDGV